MSATLRPAFLFALAALFTVVWFGALDARRLHHPDEGRYAEIAREMLASGDYVTPRLNGLKYFEKPPLQYWLTAASYALFGLADWTARLPAALFGWIAVVAVGFAGARVAGPTVGLYAAAVLAASVWPIGIAHFVSLDAVLSGWLALALCAFVVAHAATTTPAGRLRWMLAAWAALAGAVMTKGPIGLVIPAGALALYSLAARDGSIWRRVALVPGLLLVVALCAPWFWLVSLRNPEFAQFFFIHEHVQRFLTTEHRREGAWWYFVPLLLIGLLPWTGVLAWTLRDTWRAAPRAASGFSWVRFCLAWAAFVFVFFSLSGSKLPSYILPMFPALALVIGWQLARLPERTWRTLLALLAAGGVALALALLAGYDELAARIATERTPAEAYRQFGHGITLGFLVIAAGALAAWFVDRRARPGGRALSIVLLALAMNFGLLLAFWGNDGLSGVRSTADLVGRLTRQSAPPYDARAPFYQVQMYDQTLPWYLRRTTIPVDYRDELDLGLTAEPGKGIARTEEWITQWQTLPQGYALMAPDTYERLSGDVPMRIVARNPRYVLVARR